MSIQGSVNGMIGSVAGAIATGKHISNQTKDLAAKNAADKEIVANTKTAIKNDTIEAAAAISAHEPEFKAILDKGNYDLNNLSDDQVSALTKEVDAFRSGKLTEDRINNIREAGERYEKYHDNKIDRIYKTGDQLNKAYESFRELNQRIDASRQLKFNLESAQARLKARGVK